MYHCLPQQHKIALVNVEIMAVTYYMRLSVVAQGLSEKKHCCEHQQQARVNEVINQHRRLRLEVDSKH
jgi:hypothetical protein